MKKTTAFTLALLIPQIAAALPAGPLDGADFVVNCVSDRDGSSVTFARSGGTDKGFIVTEDIRGEADHPVGRRITYVSASDGTGRDHLCG